MAATRQLKTKIRETKKLLGIEKLLGVDPAGLAPASLGDNTNMLLYAPRARVHTVSIYEKSPLEKRTPFGHPTLARGAMSVLYPNYTLDDNVLSIA